MVGHIFPKIDNLSKIESPILFRLFSPLWFVEGWRNFIKISVIISAFFWAILGFDSTVGQIIPVSLEFTAPSFITIFPRFLMGQVPFSYVIEQTKTSYGLGTHWSAIVIYGLFFILLSRYYERINIKKSMNLILSLFFTLLSISIFEFSWMYSYATFQNLPWVLGIKHSPFLMNTFFVMIGILAIVFVLVSPYRFNLDKKSLFFILFSVGMWTLWVYYPFPVKSFSTTVLGTGELWQNTNNFPQTQYTLDLYPNDELRAGFAYYVGDNLVHFMNTMIKIILTYTIFNICKLRVGKKR